MHIKNKELKQLLKNGFVFFKIDKDNKKFINQINKLINKINVKNFNSKKILSLQNNINKKFNPKLFFKINKEILKNLFETNKFSIQYYFYLRAVKPISKKDKINPVNFHRESFNSKNGILKKAYNIWIPIKNCNNKNSINFYPKSHKLIENQDFKITKYITNIKKYSAEHKLGYLYKERKIKFKKKLTPKKLFKDDHFIIFSGELIHGAGFNFSEHTRYSLDMRFMLSDNLKSNMRQGSTGKNYFNNIRI